MQLDAPKFSIKLTLLSMHSRKRGDNREATQWRHKSLLGTACRLPCDVAETYPAAIRRAPPAADVAVDRGVGPIGRVRDEAVL